MIKLNSMTPKLINRIFTGLLIIDGFSVFILPIIIIHADGVCLWDSRVFDRFNSFRSYLEYDLMNKCQIGMVELSFLMLLPINVAAGLSSFFTKIHQTTVAKRPGGVGFVTLLGIGVIAAWVEGSLISYTPIDNFMSPFRMRAMTILMWMGSPLVIWCTIVGLAVNFKEVRGKI